ncbi:EpsG family protein [Clostridium perfringens]|uniref:EpsG family protein n=1 Tax=Clostridium perfringens TaxID=1502 RepID=UPI002A7507CF|nr:EpsG family protein [Clostridium perfringens]EIF6290022.1 EpsG family protein [Clostridium perfringens]MDM0780062.1 EpsG family protein [Clostridium perfringens]MDM0789064.1 EpsG family protein [Clostridium perfringens]MDM0791878.1 EpsG family protein [Clostridium perfringens]WPQ46244.1 EpsG family protein [Clostridium perfringens]
MAAFYFALIGSYVFSLIARIIKNKKNYPNLYFSIFAILILALITGLRWGIGDTPAYVHLYSLIEPGYDPKGGYELGFVLFLAILKSISKDPQFMIFVTGIITTILNLWTIRKYCKDSYFELAIFVYVASGYYLVTMNGIRQSLAASIIFAVTSFILRGEFKKYLFLCILMTTFHTSALVMIPAYYVVRNEAWSKRIYQLLILFLIGMFLYEPLMAVVYKLLGNSKYADYQNFNEGGSNILRVIVFAIPVILSYVKRDKLKEWPEANIFVNMSLISFLIMGFSLYNWIFARFTIYFQIYSFVLLAYIIKNCFEKSEKRLIYYGFLVCYFLFFIYEYKISLGIVYTSNFSISKYFYY